MSCHLFAYVWASLELLFSFSSHLGLSEGHHHLRAREILREGPLPQPAHQKSSKNGPHVLKFVCFRLNLGSEAPFTRRSQRFSVPQQRCAVLDGQRAQEARDALRRLRDFLA